MGGVETRGTPRAEREERPRSPGTARPSPGTRLKTQESTTSPHRSGPPPHKGGEGGEGNRASEDSVQRGPLQPRQPHTSPRREADNPRTRTPDTHSTDPAEPGVRVAANTPPPRLPLKRPETNQRRHTTVRTLQHPRSRRTGPGGQLKGHRAGRRDHQPPEPCQPRGGPTPPATVAGGQRVSTNLEAENDDLE